MIEALSPKEALLVLLAALLVALPGCDLFGSGAKAFPWIQDGHQMTYDFEAGPEPFVDPNTGFVYESAEDVLRYVIEEPDFADFQFVGKSPDTNEWDTHHRDGAINMALDGFFGFPGPERAVDGIRVVYPKNCEGRPGWGEDDYDSAVRVPAKPKLGRRYHRYACGDRVVETYEAIAVGETITVPAGTFEEVFVLRDRSEQQREYWSEREGLLKVERYAEDGRLLGAYVLASKNF